MCVFAIQLLCGEQLHRWLLISVLILGDQLLQLIQQRSAYLLFSSGASSSTAKM